jgi:hypothetical protein
MSVDDQLPPFACPRCKSTATERFWGPCRSCREALVAAHRGDGAGEIVGAGRYEPAMHVVPNHVATKD